MAVLSPTARSNTYQQLAEKSCSMTVLTFKHYVINERRPNRVKLSIVKSSKRGIVVLQLQEAPFTLRFVSEELIIKSGDVHPLPGPSELPKASINSTKLDLPKNLKSNIKVAHLNVRLLKSRENLVKDTLLINNIDVLTISETWADKSVSDSNIQIEGYTLFRQDRGSKKAGGGLAIYIKNNLKVTFLNELSFVTQHDFQLQWIKVQCRSFKTFIICNVYRPPSTPIKHCIDIMSNCFMDVFLSNLDIVILGDLNCNLMCSINSDANLLREFMSIFNLNQLINKPTRITDLSQSLIDVIMTNNNSLVSFHDVLSCSISDHDLVYAVLSLKTPRAKPKYISTRTYKNCNPGKFLDDLALVPFHATFFFDEIDDQVNTFNILFQEILNEHAPIKRIKIKSRPNPFLTPEIRQLMKTRDRWHTKAKNTKDKLHWNGFKFFRQEVKRELRIAEKAYARSQIINNKGNTNAIWKTINKCLGNLKTQNSK